MYTDKVMDQFTNPRNVGELEKYNGVGEVGNAKCGDIMRIYIYVENDIIKDISFKTFGCGAAIATSSVSTEMVKGKTIKEALKITNKQVVEELGGLPDVKLHCSVLAEGAIKAAILDYLTKEGRQQEADVRKCTGCCSSCNDQNKISKHKNKEMEN